VGNCTTAIGQCASQGTRERNFNPNKQNYELKIELDSKSNKSRNGIFF
jgi:hypothetical protein